jgi:hypothetical protein
MTKYLTAKQKSRELGISLSGLRQSRHLYKHIKKSPRKYLYFGEENRPFIPEPVHTNHDKRSKVRRREVLPGDTRYHKCPGGSGESFKLLNQMRSKMALEGSIPKEEQEAFNGALAHKVKENYKEINEQRKAKLRSELMAQEERARKKDPSRYGGMIRGPRSGLVDVRTNWSEIFPREKDEYELALEELGEKAPKKNRYY